MPRKISFSRGQVVWVPFPHVENPRDTKERYALVLHDYPYPPETGCGWKQKHQVMLAYITRKGALGNMILRVLPTARNGLGEESFIHFSRIQTVPVNLISRVEGDIDPNQYQEVLLNAFQVESN